MSLDDAYRQGLADYEAALVAQAQEQSASPEAYYYQGLMDYEQALLQQAAAGEGAGGGGEALYLQGMADYEALLMQHQAEQTALASEAGATPEEQEAYALGLMHREAELVANSLADAVKNLAADHRKAYDRGRAAYDAALAQQQPAQGPGADPQGGGQKPAAGRRAARGARKRAARG